MKCPHSERCIRRELFCDRVTNCVWPNGDVAYDEIKCDEYNSSSVGKVFSPANIPVIIIVVIVGIGVVIVFVVAMRTFYRSMKRQQAEEGDGRDGRRAGTSVSLRRRMRLRRRQEEEEAAAGAAEAAAAGGEATAPLRPTSSGPPNGATSLSPSAPMTTGTTAVAPAPSAPPPPGPNEMPPEYEDPPPYTEVATRT